MAYWINWRSIEGNNASVYVIISQRGLGKTFGKVKDSISDFLDNNTNRFVYVVETKDMVNVLSQNKGEKFFGAVIEYFQNNPSRRHNRYLKQMLNAEVEEGNVLNKIEGGTIKIANKTAGYIVAVNDFANLKRNNFINIKNIIIDEFIPEVIDIRYLKYAYKLANLIQSIARLKDVKIYMLGNAIRSNDSLLLKMGLGNMRPGETRKIYKNGKLFLYALMVNPKDYEEYTKDANLSVAGLFSEVLGETGLEKNEYKKELPEELELPKTLQSSHLLLCLHNELGSIRINEVKDHSVYYVLMDYGVNTKKRITFDNKLQSNIISYYPEWKELLLIKYTQGKILFENEYVYKIFKNSLNLL